MIAYLIVALIFAFMIFATVPKYPTIMSWTMCGLVSILLGAFWFPLMIFLIYCTVRENP